MRTSKIRLDRISSSTRNARLSHDVIVGDEVVSAEGYVLAVRVLTDKPSYNVVEDPTGRMVALRAGDILAGTLGSRRALRGYAGEIPATLAVGDRVDVLNLGGILGRCISENPEIGPPFQAEVLGAVLAFPDLGDRIGRPATIKDRAIPPADRLECTLPIVYVAGTCMHAGKTVAATELVRGLSRSGMRVGCVKLTGVSLMRDTLSMRDAGAMIALTFNDAGAASTHAGVTVPIARGLLNRLADMKGAALGLRPDVILAELGDGILGEYGVQDILRAPDLMRVAAAHVVAAPDPVGCWGAREIYRDSFGQTITVLTGPATDNAVGSDYIASALDIPSHNARRDPQGLTDVVLDAISEWRVAQGVELGL